MNKHNCWDFMKCGRGPGGDKVSKEAICPVAAEAAAHTLNGGINGGRLCWIIAESNGGENIRCSVNHNKNSCFSCQFRFKVNSEEGLLNICKSTGVYLSNYPSFSKNIHA